MKVDDYNLSKLSNEAENFKEDVTNILNYGKYSGQVVANTPPSWTARNGEFVFFASGTIKRLYFYNINSWDFIEYNAGTVGGLGTSIVSTDTLFNDPTIIAGLSFQMAVSETWTFEIFASTSSGTAGQNFNINAPGGSTAVLRYLGISSNGGVVKENINAVNTQTSSGFFGASTANYLQVSGTVQTGASSAGSLTFAANVVGAVAAGSIKAGSYISFRKVV